MSAEFDNILFDMPKTQSNSIKVIGVGGGGSNAVNHMFQQQIKGVDFVICNTDAQALESSSIPNKIQLGASLTSGLGAGAKPEVGAQAAKESIIEIQQMLNTQTKMVFITAGMGGGTGTGAAPIIAKIAKDMDILTVGIVTMPFQFEGRMRSKQAQIGIDTLRNNVDSLIVINNNKLREVYGNLGYKAGFSKADEVLSTAARGIAEVITHHYKQNIDLHDAKTVLSNSGTAIMGSAKETGDKRAKNAIKKALDSPLLNDNKITGAKNVLLLIVSGVAEVTLDEIGEINDFIQTEAGYDANIIMGIGEDEELGDNLSITVVATGFAADQQSMITNTEAKKIIHTLEDEQKATYDFSENNIVKSLPLEELFSLEKEEKIIHVLDTEEEEIPKDLIATSENIKNIAVTYEVIENSEEEFIITDSEQITALEKDTPINLTEENSLNTEKIKAATQPIVEKRYVLENFDTTPTIDKSSTTKLPIQEKVEEELQIKLKSTTSQKEINFKTGSKEVSPSNLTISELKAIGEERHQKMKKLNYKFTKNIDDIERQPAYKRMGVHLTETNSKTKIPLNTNDKEDEIQLNVKNSFLHDNVD